MRASSSLLLAVILGCASGTKGNGSAGSRAGAEGPSGDSRDYVGKDALVDYATLTFIDDDERQRFERIRACLRQRGQGWEHYPLRTIGNFIEEDWCRGQGADHGCSGGRFREIQDVDWAGVGTLHYPDQGPQVFGVQVEVGHRPAGDGWNVSVSVSSNGKGILGEHGSIIFEHPGRAQRFYVGTGYSHQIAQTQIDIPVDGDGWTLLDRVRASPQALKQEALTHWDALRAKVLAALDAGEVVECVYGEYEGRGIPPECIEKVPLSPDKVKTARAEIEAQVQAVHAAFDQDGDALHATLLQVAPTDCI